MPFRASNYTTFPPTSSTSSLSSTQSFPTAAHRDQLPASPTNLRAPLSEIPQNNDHGDDRPSNTHKRKFGKFHKEQDGDHGQGAGIIPKKRKRGTEDLSAEAAGSTCMVLQIKAEALKEKGLAVTSSEAGAGAKTLQRGYAEGIRDVFDVLPEIGLEEEASTMCNAQGRSMSNFSDVEAGDIDIEFCKTMNVAERTEAWSVMYHGVGRGVYEEVARAIHDELRTGAAVYPGPKPRSYLRRTKSLPELHSARST